MARKGESIYKRKDGRWEARFAKTNQETGAKLLTSVYGKTYMEVKNKRAAIMQKLAIETSNPPQSSLTVSELMYLWLDFNRSQITPSSYQKYEGMIRNHITPGIGLIKISQLTKATFRQFSHALLTRGNVKSSGVGLSVKSVNSIFTIINSALNWSSEWTDVPFIKIPFLREFHSSPQILSETEQVSLESFACHYKNAYTTGILISLYTGMRLGEVCALQWEDVSEEVFFVHRSMQRIKTESGHWEVVLSEPKTTNSRRVIPIPDCLKGIINENRKNTGFVLQQENGNFIEPRLMQKKIKDIFKNSNVSIGNFHALRHTFSTRLIALGCDPKTVSELLGHSTVQITLNKYVHPSFDMKKTAIEKVCLQPDAFICGQIYGSK